MTGRLRLRNILTALLCVASSAAYAHSFGTPYILPIPFWMYVYGCAGTLVVTFAVLGYFVGASAGPRPIRVREVPISGLLALVGRWLLVLLRASALACLAITILSGIIGTDDPSQNIGMTLFWVVFLLGFAYLTLLIGDLYALINPWKLLLAGIERLGLNLTTPRLIYPSWLGAWPAFIFYLALVWIELFIPSSPSTLSILLGTYSAITFCAAAAFGKEIWLEQADFFSVYFRVIGLMSPVAYTETQNGHFTIQVRPPFSGAVNVRPQHAGLVMFVLFMLSATAYDGIYDTQLWTALYWRNLLAIFQPLWGSDLAAAQSMLMNGFLVYRKAGLVLFPFIYLSFYLLALLGTRVLVRSAPPLRSLALDFCYSLMPIAFAYNFIHYYTFLVSQAVALPWLLSDPFGFDWNLFNLPDTMGPATLKMGVIWHTQVAILLIGHIVSVAVAHHVAMRTFATQRAVIISQLPLLVLMVGYTSIGLWILTLPLG